MRPGENWVCPYCLTRQVVSLERWDYYHRETAVENCDRGPTAYALEALVCADAACRKMSSTVVLYAWNTITQKVTGFPLQMWRLLPESTAKPLPDYIPQGLVQDYTEACKIRDLSPKASATLSRRCLQGMIRDFCNIPKQRSLWHEIEELKKLVDSGRAPRGVQADSIDAIHAVREVGNVGAHMEGDINLIVDVDPEEAKTLIELLELLFDEWYIEREKRRIQLGKIAAAAERVKSQKQT